MIGQRVKWGYCASHAVVNSVSDERYIPYPDGEPGIVRVLRTPRF
jgi:hypothetical protein